jgi:hypothetical protein
MRTKKVVVKNLLAIVKTLSKGGEEEVHYRI